MGIRKHSKNDQIFPLSLFAPLNGVRLRNESGGGSRSGATCALASLYNAAVWAAERGSQQSAGYRQQRRLATTDSAAEQRSHMHGAADMVNACNDAASVVADWRPVVQRPAGVGASRSCGAWITGRSR